MRVLVADSSKHGSTREIAESIGSTLRQAGVGADVVDAAGVASLDAYDAVVVGSALHLGRWMRPARELVQGHLDELRAKPVWLFSSGPLGRNIADPADAAEGVRLCGLVAGRDHRLFPGKADKAQLGFVERRILSMVKNPYGDHRDWAVIGSWAVSIAHDVVARQTPAHGAD